MTPGSIVVVDWRDALPRSGEPNKKRPAIVIGSPCLFGSALPFEIVVPLTGTEALAIAGASLTIEPSFENECTKRSYALSWCVQTVSHERITPASGRIAAEQLAAIRKQVAACIEAA